MAGYNRVYFKPDVINRQEVNTLVDELEKAISYERSFMSIGRSTGEIMHDIRNLQSVIPQPNVGQWIVDRGYNADKFGISHFCSICKGYAIDDEGLEILTDYCPWCGAKMQEDKE